MAAAENATNQQLKGLGTERENSLRTKPGTPDKPAVSDKAAFQTELARSAMTAKPVMQSGSIVDAVNAQNQSQNQAQNAVGQDETARTKTPRKINSIQFRTLASDRPNRNAVNDSDYERARLRLREVFAPSAPVLNKEHFAGRTEELERAISSIENERMHLMTFIKIAQPSVFERGVIMIAQVLFYNAYFFMYLLAPRTAHRFVAYLEEEAVISYTHYLEAVDRGELENVAAPQIARDYWELPVTARLRDVIVKVREDEAGHRDVNHRFADALTRSPADPTGRKAGA